MQSVYSQLSQIAENNAQPDNTNRTLTELEIEREIAACAASFYYFCTNYAYVTEPRPPTEDSDPDEDNDFLQFFKAKQYQSTLDAGSLALLQKDLEALATEKGYSPELKFKLWPFQVEGAAWLEWLLTGGKSGAIEKCRDMGMSWLVLWFIIWCWRFRPGFQALIGSRKEAAVDNGKLDSLFGKLDYGISKLPEWLQPKGYKRDKHRTRLSIVNPELAGNFIAGDSQTEDFGRSGRYSLVFLDEYAFWSMNVWTSCLNLTKTVIAGSTVNGQNQFFDLTERLKQIPGGRRVLRMEWHKNPNHTQAWFQQQQRESDEASFAREVLIDYRASVVGKYYPVCNTVKLVPGLKWSANWPAFLSWDFGIADNCALIWWQHNPESTQHRMMFAYTSTGKPIEFYVPFALVRDPDKAILERDRYTDKPVLDSSGKPKYVQLTKLFQYTAADYQFIETLKQAGVTASLSHRGDPAGRSRSHDTARSVIDVLRSAGIDVFSNTEQNRYKARRDALTSVLMKTEVNVDTVDTKLNRGSGGAWEAFNAISQSKYPERREGSNSTTPPTGPVHDWTSHYRSSAEYYAVGEFTGGGYQIINLFEDDGDDAELEQFDDTELIEDNYYN